MRKQHLIGILSLTFLIYSYNIYTKGTIHKKGGPYYSAEAKKGKAIFQEKNCISCHQIYGLGGYMGPDLTNIISIRNQNESIARAFLKMGTKKMPNFQLSETEIDNLILYLKYLDQAANYPPSNFKISPIGTVNLNNKE